jgi:hypothetical protein
VKMESEQKGVKETGCECFDWIELAQDRVQ